MYSSVITDPARRRWPEGRGGQMIQIHLGCHPATAPRRCNATSISIQQIQKYKYANTAIQIKSPPVRQHENAISSKKMQICAIQQSMNINTFYQSFPFRLLSNTNIDWIHWLQNPSTMYYPWVKRLQLVWWQVQYQPPLCDMGKYKYALCLCGIGLGQCVQCTAYMQVCFVFSAAILPVWANCVWAHPSLLSASKFSAQLH